MGAAGAPLAPGAPRTRHIGTQVILSQNSDVLSPRPLGLFLSQSHTEKAFNLKVYGVTPNTKQEGEVTRVDIERPPTAAAADGRRLCI